MGRIGVAFYLYASAFANTRPFQVMTGLRRQRSQSAQQAQTDQGS